MTPLCELIVPPGINPPRSSSSSSQSPDPRHAKSRPHAGGHGLCHRQHRSRLHHQGSRIVGGASPDEEVLGEAAPPQDGEEERGRLAKWEGGVGEDGEAIRGGTDDLGRWDKRYREERRSNILGWTREM